MTDPHARKYDNRPLKRWEVWARKDTARSMLRYVDERSAYDARQRLSNVFGIAAQDLMAREAAMQDLMGLKPSTDPRGSVAPKKKRKKKATVTR